MQWKHPTLKKGRIAFDLRARADIVEGVFEAPDDPVLADRLRAAGCVPATVVAAEPREEIPEEIPDEPPADNPRGKKGR